MALGSVVFFTTNVSAQQIEIVDNDIVKGVNLKMAFVDNHGILDLGLDVKLDKYNDIRVAPEHNCSCPPVQHCCSHG